MLRSLIAVALAAGLAGCVVDPGPAYYGYDPGYYSGPGYYAPGSYAPATTPGLRLASLGSSVGDAVAIIMDGTGAVDASTAVKPSSPM